MTATKTMVPASRLFAFFFLVAIAAAGVMVAVALDLPQIRLNTHAVERHGSDAVEIRRCLDRNGPADVWRKFHSDRWILLCRLDDGRWGMQIIQKVQQVGEKVESKYEEVTSFVRGGGTLRETLEYLSQQATRWKGPLPR